MPIGLLVLMLLGSLAASAQEHRFLVLFGGADVEVSDWSGSVSASGGEVTIEGMRHFAPSESFDAGSWRAGNQWDGTLNMLPQEEAVFPKTRWKGIQLDVDGSDGASIRLETAQGNAEFRVGAIRFQQEQRLLDGRIRVQRVPRSEAVYAGESAADASEDSPALAAGPDGRVWLAWIASDGGQESLHVRYSDDGKGWSTPERLVDSLGDYHQVALVSTAPRSLLAVWSATVEGNVDLHARSLVDGDWEDAERLTREAGPDTFPHLAAAPDGSVYLAWQSAGRRRTDVSLRRWRSGRWAPARKLTEHPASDWEPAVAVNSRGEVAVVWDSYRHGNYDLFLRRMVGDELGPLERLTDSQDFEAHSSIAYDGRDRLWIAYDNGGPNWGKDNHGINGILRNEGGLYSKRKVEVRVLERGRLVQPTRSLDEKLPGKPVLGSRMTLGLESSYQTFSEFPQLQVDAQGRLWALVRMRTIGRYNPPERETRSILPYWTDLAVMFDGEGWSEPISLPFSDGRQDQRAAVALDRAGDLWVATPTDGWSRAWADPLYGQYDLFVGKIEVERVAAGAVDRELLVGAEGPAGPLTVDDEDPPLKAPIWKTYQMEVGEESFELAWGDLHRHTDLSFDGQSDGSLYDVYRYAIDAAEMDFLGPSEHLLPQNDLSAYVWRMVDNAVDLYKLPGFFYPLLNYERTVKYPDGHRNIVSRARGFQQIRIKQGAGPADAAEDDQLYLWEKLLAGGERPQALSIPHTTATQMGTNWRYNDERVERLVEIYQGNRDSYEYFGAPKGAVAEQLLVGGYITSGQMKKDGFVWNALAKGYKMGFIASSDHRATHNSYAAVYTPKRSYDAIWDSLYARRTYAATDTIVVDFQSGGHAMGEEFETDREPLLEVAVIGTDVIAQLDLIKNNAIIYTSRPGARELSFSYADRDAEPGESYYYFRVIQQDGNMAWASPIWIRYQP